MNDLFENWEDTKSALLEGLDSQKKSIVSPLLENQKNQILKETAAAGSTEAHNIAGFRKILIPMIRRIIPGSIATELVGVQPMQGPVGLVYTLRYAYADNMNVDAGAASPPWADGLSGDHYAGAIAAGDEVFGNSTPLRQYYSGAAGDGTTQPNAQGAGAGGIDVSYTQGADSGLDTQDDIALAGIDTEAMGSSWPSSLDSASGCTVGGSGSFIEGSGGRKMTLEVISQAVEAGSRKLQAGWTIEAMQDLNAQHGLDLESEMTKALSAEIVQEIDAEILTDLVALAGTAATYDGAVPAGADYYQPTYAGDRLANLAVLINYIANEIGRKTRRGVGNWMVVSPMVVSVLQSAAKSVFAPSTSGAFKGPNNTMLAGTLNGTIKVYTYLWNQSQSTDVGGSGDDTILIGYKGGNGETDTGYFYCPYVPLMSSGVVVNPVTFQPVVSLMTRYGKTSFTSTSTSLGNSADYYGKINVTNLSFA